MKPKFWQLRNRIKYVERLRSGVDKQNHGEWETGCGVCALGSALRTMRGCNINKGNALFSAWDRSIENPDERKELSVFLGLNYLELANISRTCEGSEGGVFGSSFCEQSISHKQIADYVEKLHITLYLWMIEKHYTNYKTKAKLELQEELICA